MDAAAELGKNPIVCTRLSMEMSRLTRDGTAEPISRDQILRHARGQGNIHFSCSADHEQDWQPYPVDPYSAICDDDDHTYIHDCTLLWQILTRIGVPPQMIAVMQQFHNGMRACVRPDDGVCSDWFEVEQGLRQECVLSPLFSTSSQPY